MIIYGAERQLEKLTKMGDQLVGMKEKIKWELFREMIEKAVRKPDYKKGGRPPYDVIMMFKIVML
jgi:hypothetical protein